jgi:Tetracyclin repressor, C-terminal all-alpha domain.
MRAVADELGTGPMTLYNYVDSREQLEALVVDAAFAEAKLPSAKPNDRWQQRVVQIGIALADVVSAHPDVAPLILTRQSMSPDVLRPAEALLEVLSSSGIRDAKLLVAFRTVLATITGVIQADVAGPMSQRRGQNKSQVLNRFADLDRTEYPRLVELAATARVSSLRQELKGALAIVIAGIEADIEPEARR